MATEASLESVSQDRQKLESDRDALEAQLKSVQQELAESQTLAANARQDAAKLRDHAGDVEATLVADQVRIRDLTEELKQESAALDQERQLLALGHDVTDLMGACNLHIVDVVDTDPRGKTRPAFGRIFFTEGKSLVFYAYDLNEARLQKANYHYRVFGGPIWRNKTFFFFSYEGLRLRQPQSKVIQVPSLAYRASAIPAAAAVLNAYPAPSANAAVTPDGVQSPFTGVWSNQVTTDAFSVRIDHTLNTHLSLFGRFSGAPSSSLSRFASLSTLKNQEVDTTTVTAGANWVVSRSIFDSLRFNYSTQTAFGLNSLDNFRGATPIPPAGLLLPGTSVNDSIAIFNPFIDQLSGLEVGIDAKNQVQQWNVLDDITITNGPHQLKFGGRNKHSRAFLSVTFQYLIAPHASW